MPSPEPKARPVGLNPPAVVFLPRSEGRVGVQSLVRALNAALDRLREGVEREKRFTADAAHELRTPLSVMRTQCDVVLRRPREPEELRLALEAVRGVCVGMSAFVEGLLTLARFHERTVPPPMARLDLSAVALEAVRLHESAARAKGIELLADFRLETYAEGDHSLLVACVSQFVENAIRYTPTAGRVRVTGGEEPAPFVAVEDTGIGIAEDQQERIFDRFYRVDPSRSRAGGGAGLGLAIAREIERVHGAEIFVESRPGQGSRFELRFRNPSTQPT